MSNSCDSLRVTSDTENCVFLRVHKSRPPSLIRRRRTSLPFQGAKPVLNPPNHPLLRLKHGSIEMLKSAWRGKNPGEEGDSDRHGDGDKDSDMEVVAARLKVKRACCHLAHNWPTSSNCHHSENDGSKICRSLHYISPSISNCGTICLWPPICTTAS
ncbi:hypothetical protein J6590_012310 [Homalodisca vitripennis]|nr:hypothetical protein J6590_012310 [Homalodisca vitripennis]